MNADSGQGFALKPTRRLCLLDLWLRARPLAIYLLDGWGRRADTGFSRSRLALLPYPPKSMVPRGLGREERTDAPWSGLGAKPRSLPGPMS